MVKFYPNKDSEEMNDFLVLHNKSKLSKMLIRFLLHMNGGFGIRNESGNLVACISRDEFFSEGFVNSKFNLISGSINK